MAEVMTMDGQSDDIGQVRSRICNVLLVVFAIAAAPTLAASLYRITAVGWLPIMWLHIALVAILWFLALFRKRVPYRLRAGSIIALFLVVGLAGLWSVGLQSAYWFMIVAPAFCAVFFGTRAGIAILVASLLASAAIGLDTVLQQRLPPFDLSFYAVQPSAWLGMVMSWTLVATALLSVVVMYNEGLFSALTSARRHEEALRKSEDRFRSVVENSPNALSLKDTEGRYLMVNGRFESLMGVRREDVIGATAYQVFAGAFGDSGIEQDREVIRRKEAVQFDESFDRGDRVLSILTTKIPIFGNEQEITSIVAVHTDLTDSRLAEEDATQLGRILEDSPFEIYSIDVDSFRFVRVNRGARENLGYSIDELRQLTPADIAPNFDPKRLRDRLELLKDGEQQHFAYETVHRRKDGTTYPVRLRLLLVTYQGAQLLFGIAEDITERQRTEAQLQQAQKMEAVGQLTGGVAHDFNNLLSIILGNLELVEDSLAGEDDSRYRIDKAIRATERGAQLTRRLLAFSRKQPLRPVPVDARKLCEDMLDLLRRSLGETIKIEIAAGDDLCSTEIDPGQLESALLNLAINARDAMPSGGKLIIAVSNVALTEEDAADQVDVEPGQYVLVSVSDTGEGMTRDMCEKVFDPFFTTKEAGRGTGLGLSMVHGFVKQSGGHIAISSEVGAGTTVRLYLPRYGGDKPVAQSLEMGDESANGTGEVVLVVEDDVDLRFMTTSMLLSLRYGVVESGTARTALKILAEKSKVSLLLTDMVLPDGISGRDLADRARKMDPGLPVLYMSGYSEDAIIHHGRLDEGVQLLEKPFRKADLARAVHRALHGEAG